jgi:hypothetical protein
MSSIENQADDKDTIIMNLRKIICDLQKENKELYKKLGIFYRPQNQDDGKDGGKDDGKDGLANT